MADSQSLLSFIQQESGKLAYQMLTHIGLTVISLFIAVLIGLPAGILIAHRRRLSAPVLGMAGILQTIPSIALLGFMIPLLGIGPKPAIAALFLYSLLPIIRNTFTGIIGVSTSVLEAAKGMGMSSTQVLFKIELPLAMPIILAGIRTATVINIGVATLAAYIAAGGLGEFIFGGIALNNTNMILAGAIPAALLAILFDFLLSLVQRANLRKLKPAFTFAAIAILVLFSFFQLPATRKGTLLAGFTPEFIGRKDGYIGLKKTYHLDIHSVVISDAVMYQAAYDHKLDVISGYSTDGRLRSFDLVTLMDDRHIFPPYYAAPIVRQEVLQKYPEIEPVLNMLGGRINDSVMTALNYRATYLNEPPEKIAKDFLVAQGLWKMPRNGQKGIIRIGSKIFPEQYILVNMYSMLIEGYTDLKVATKTGLGGTQICFNALTNNQIDLYPEYTGTGLLVLLQPNEDIVNRLITNKDSVYAFVQRNFINTYHIKWLRPIGFNNAYALMMRRQQSTDLHVRTITDLANYLRKK